MELNALIDLCLTCACEAEHVSLKPILDAVFDAPISNVWKTLFGSSYKQSEFMKLFWEKDMGYKQVQLSPWSPSTLHSHELSNRLEDETPLEAIQTGWHQHIEYLVPFNNPLGTYIHYTDFGRSKRSQDTGLQSNHCQGIL
jgi:hypothetical protein